LDRRGTEEERGRGPEGRQREGVGRGKEPAGAGIGLRLSEYCPYESLRLDSEQEPSSACPQEVCRSS
jgi:hypothetical protein